MSTTQAILNSALARMAGACLCFYCDRPLSGSAWEPMLLVHDRDGTDREHVGVCAYCIAESWQAVEDYVRADYDPTPLPEDYNSENDWLTYW